MDTKSTSLSPGNTENPYPLPGLSTAEVDRIRASRGEQESRRGLSPGWRIVREIVTEPMFLILIVTASIYFILQETTEAFFMLGAIALISAISWYQSSRAQQALDALNAYTQVLVRVIRDNRLLEIKREALVPGDFVVVTEGDLIPVDGQLVLANDLSVNESILTGEAFAVSKQVEGNAEEQQIFQGTLALSGQGVVRATAVAEQTRMHQIGRAIDELDQQKSVLQLQVERFVKRMAILGTAVFFLILLVDFFRTREFLNSLLEGLTIAMSVLPEEIPVAFTVFLALGAFRLAKQDIIVKRSNTTESLGSVNVLCLDKTGTITENRMELRHLYTYQDDTIKSSREAGPGADLELIQTAMWASETTPFDPMEQALHRAYEQLAPTDERGVYHMVDEYPLSGKPPMMTHVFSRTDRPEIIATKGAPEAVLACTRLSETEKEHIREKIDRLSAQGLRILGVGRVDKIPETLPAKQQDLTFEFLGLVGFYDPPKKDIQASFQRLYRAGIQLKIITGDSINTTTAIARQSGFVFDHPPITGAELDELSPEQLAETTRETELFCRIAPEQKLRIVQSLKDQGLIVGMTGDGVNDGLALKAAHIGIAMGLQGTEIARRAASLILVNGKLDAIAEAVAVGRRIYDNLKKAIQYIISIHIPIILTVTIPILLNWKYAAIFSPVHVIFLELIMGPTCSIVYENEPMEPNTMDRPPRAIGQTFFGTRELLTSILQGLVITAGVLGVYGYGLAQGLSETTTRSLVFLTLLIANIFLTLVNRSFYYSIFQTIRYKNRRMVWILLLTISLMLLMVYLPPLAAFFGIAPLSWLQLGIAVAVGAGTTLWFELVKGWGTVDGRWSKVDG
ncbi:cation-translocating P-type ATPase [Flavilitoribacter nigricans]|uniref:cation-translocating P-type ATPase n=1 Tax=Flavilitoribacter nigricans TaxID=70997 RepID=UPI001C9E7442|nr:cation-translocating P-type ATPase [Flavilitoribacter nigricans]